MQSDADFECEGCGLLLDPSFEVGRVDCAGGCEAEVWVCLSCGRKPGGVRCGSCAPAWRAKREAKREAREQAKSLADLRRFLARGQSPCG